MTIIQKFSLLRIKYWNRCQYGSVGMDHVNESLQSIPQLGHIAVVSNMQHRPKAKVIQEEKQ